MIRYLVLVALAILAPAFCAADAPIEKAVVAQTLESYETEAATVRDGMQPGGVYGYIKAVQTRHAWTPASSTYRSCYRTTLGNPSCRARTR